jgi:hypothetical protein
MAATIAKMTSAATIARVGQARIFLTVCLALSGASKIRFGGTLWRPLGLEHDHIAEVGAVDLKRVAAGPRQNRDGRAVPP